MATPPIVYLIDDDQLLCEYLTELLRKAGFETRSYYSAASFLESATGVLSGCVVTDIYMPGMDGIELLRHLAEMRFAHPVIVITGRGDIQTAIKVIKAGAVDFIEKPLDDQEFLIAVRSALASDQERQQANSEIAQISAHLAKLTAREREVLDGMVQGHPNKVIAYNLGVSQRTVEVHRARVMEKAGVRNLSDLVRMVLIADGVLSPQAARRPGISSPGNGDDDDGALPPRPPRSRNN
ncbi:MAG TPA: response regulator [Magnetospirillaceae bacterium]